MASETFTNFSRDNSSSAQNLDQDSYTSDCESTLSSNSSSPCLQDSMKIFDESSSIEIDEQDSNFQLIRRLFMSSTFDYPQVVSIRRRNWSKDLVSQARHQAFQIHVNALSSKVDNGRSDVKFAWYGGSVERINEILTHGFSLLHLQDNNGVIFLSPHYFSTQSMQKSIPDEQGIRHLLLCRVLLGRSELIPKNTIQTQPSSPEFDSGINDYDNSTKYLIWSHNMNSRILPEYVVSFTKPVNSPFSMQGISETMQKGIKIPNTPWITLPALIKELGKFLPCDAICSLSKFYHQYRERKMTRTELIKILRKIAGDKLLISVIKSCKKFKEHNERLKSTLRSDYPNK